MIIHADFSRRKKNRKTEKKQEKKDKKNDHEGGKSGGKSSFYKQINLAKCFQKTDGHHMPVKAL